MSLVKNTTSIHTLSDLPRADSSSPSNGKFPPNSQSFTGQQSLPQDQTIYDDQSLHNSRGLTNQLVILNVGGRIFQTTIYTLTRGQDTSPSFFHGLFRNSVLEAFQHSNSDSDSDDEPLLDSEIDITSLDNLTGKIVPSKQKQKQTQSMEASVSVSSPSDSNNTESQSKSKFQPLLNNVASNSTQIIRDLNGNIFIDRDPALFSVILDYLRTGYLDISALPPQISPTRLQFEASYYSLEGLVDYLSQVCQQDQDDFPSNQLINETDGFYLNSSNTRAIAFNNAKNTLFLINTSPAPQAEEQMRVAIRTHRKIPPLWRDNGTSSAFAIWFQHTLTRGRFWSDDEGHIKMKINQTTSDDLGLVEDSKTLLIYHTGAGNHPLFVKYEFVKM